MKRLLLILCLALAGCGAGTPEAVRSPDTTQPANIGRYINRYIDEEAGVVCYVYTNYNQGGISCLPIGDTNLSDK